MPCRLFAADIAYQGMGPITHITWGNGLSQLYTYDQSGRVSGYALSNGAKNVTFAYDGNNNITQQLDIANTVNSYGYDYDELNRLEEENGYLHSALPGGTPYNKAYQYDAVSNRLSKASGSTTENYNYNDTSNRLQGVDAESYQYDANGNLIARGQQSWQYNAQNRMSSYSEGGQVQATYTYNGQGERVSKQLSNGETIHYLYNAAGQLQGEYHYTNGNLTLRQSYVWLGMLPIAMLKEDLAGQTEQLVYIHSDHLNSPRMVTDQNQNTVWQWHSSAFGEELPIENGLVFNLRFPGQYFDVESGINYNYYRDYDPNTGRYLQSDPIGLAGGMNTYGYVGGNPVGFVDPVGLRDVIVAIWTSRLLSGSVGHVFVGEANGDVINSQFPTPHSYEGDNTTKTWKETLGAEGRGPDYIYQVTVPNDTAFNDSASKARNADRWYVFPDGENSTHCTMAANKDLRKGGVTGVSSTSAAWPNWLNSDLLIASWLGNQVKRLTEVPW